jgi:cytoskeletal protein CcmA (bactofilin family)
MALFGREREDRPEPEDDLDPGPREVEMFERERDKTRPEETGGTSAFLGKGTRINGKLAFEGTVRIEGQVEGEIAAQDTLTIGEGAVVKAKVSGASIIVHGQVNGDITARTRLELRAPSKVMGNINTPSLVISEGAIFEGQCAMGGAAETGRKGKKADFSALLDREEPLGDALSAPPENRKS